MFSPNEEDPIHRTAVATETFSTVAIGPRMEGFGSWHWLGADLARGLAGHLRVQVFDRIPAQADIVLWIKFLSSYEELVALSAHSRIVYCPVDAYGSAAEIDQDDERLTACDVIALHTERLQTYFQSYSRTVVFEHHVKYAIPTRTDDCSTGPLLWVGVRSNLQPLVDYVNCRGLPGPLVVLTNPERDEDLRDPSRWGFAGDVDVTLERWSPETQRVWLARCRAALDIKGDDFRARHKPAAKALDFLASGVPLAMNAGTSSVEAVRKLGFEIAAPEHVERWLSPEYARETQAFGRRISEELSLPRLSDQWRRLLASLHAVPKSTTPQESVRSSFPVAAPSASVDRCPTRIALVSLLFNWPSTGGGTVHTAETARFLSRAGYDVRHFVIQYAGWNIGQVSDQTDWPIEFVRFDDAQWRRTTIQSTIRGRVRAFAPDAVIITDSWNFKPRLAECLGEFPYYLRLAAQEGLCPLNNVRLLWDDQGGFQSCPRQQLATPDACRQCVQQRGRWSGDLHRAERELAGFFESDYAEVLRRSFAGAAGVLVVNPLIAENVKPFAQRVHVIPSGFDPARFPWPAAPEPEVNRPKRMLFAGLIQEPMKGFSVLHEACQHLWSQRRDFVLQATADPLGRLDEFTEFVGWQSQSDLPGTLRAADIVVCPTVAEEALGRTAVEAMGVGRPVVASRIGGLPFTVLDEATGLLCEPNDPRDLARQLGRLLDNAALRQRFGEAGRRRFESHYTWPAILTQHYRPLLGDALRPVTGGLRP